MPHGNIPKSPIRNLSADETPPIDQRLRMASQWPEFLADLERLKHAQAFVHFNHADTLGVHIVWDAPTTPHEFMAAMAVIEKGIVAKVSLTMQANAMHWIYEGEALKAYRTAATAFYAGRISEEDLAAVGRRLSKEQRDAIVYSCSPFGAAS